MKNLILFCFIYFSFQFLKAQDTIVKRNGEKLIVKLAEVNLNDVRYKRLDLPDGPLYTLPKQEIKIVIYYNGIKESFENFVPPVVNSNSMPFDLSMQSSGDKYYFKERKIEEPDMLAVVGKLGDKKINLMIKKVNDLKFIQKTTMIVSIPLFIFGAYTYFKNAPRRTRRAPSATTTAKLAQGRMNGEYLMLGAITCDIVSISFKLSRIKHAHMVVDAYNKTITEISHR